MCEQVSFEGEELADTNAIPLEDDEPYEVEAIAPFALTVDPEAETTYAHFVDSFVRGEIPDGFYDLHASDIIGAAGVTPRQFKADVEKLAAIYQQGHDQRVAFAESVERLRNAFEIADERQQRGYF